MKHEQHSIIRSTEIHYTLSKLAILWIPRSCITVLYWDTLPESDIVTETGGRYNVTEEGSFALGNDGLLAHRRKNATAGALAKKTNNRY